MQGTATIGRSVNPIRPADGVASQVVVFILIHRRNAYNSACRCNAQPRGGVQRWVTLLPAGDKIQASGTAPDDDAAHPWPRHAIRG